MGRVNKTIDGVFIDIVGNDREISCYDQFLNQTEINSKPLKNLIKSYDDLVQKHRPIFEKLAQLEEIIIQLRIRHTLDNIKLSQVREYIYARTPFYRKDKKAKDVRIIVDKIDFRPEVIDGPDGVINIDILYDDKEFMSLAKAKLGKAMDKEINDNIKNLINKL